MKHIPKHKKLALRKNSRKRKSWNKKFKARDSLEKQGYSIPKYSNKYSYLFGV